MSDKTIHVPGYVQRQLFTNGIEYRNFSPDLVGFQITSDGGTPLFTMGNFNITTNMEPKSDKFFITNDFSNFITLTDLDASLENINKVLTNRNGAILNLANTNLKYDAQFGSFTEFARVSLEDIIINWPASLYIYPRVFEQNNIINGFTYENYIYDSLTETATFKINTTFVNNKFQLNILSNGELINSYNETNDLRNVTANYKSYVIWYNEIEYPVLEFTGATSNTNDYIYFKVSGNPFTGTSSNLIYHIKPNKTFEDTFFKIIPNFERYLLNRLIVPKYTSTFNYSIKSELGDILYITDSITWPTTDGYNIDFDTNEYIEYATKLFEIAEANDLTSSDLMNRFLVSESISAFDTSPVNMDYMTQDQTGQKVTKTLRIYGRNFDEINNYIDGIAFSNVVSYNKEDNTPDLYLKNLARVLGWELVSSIIENGLLSSYVTTPKSTYSGHSVGLTPVEADIELWRRLILNTPWLWKSKGARKSIEFLFKFIGVPLGLIQFNEYVYKTEEPIDIDLFRKALELNGLDENDLSVYPIDDEGYPRPFPDTPTTYFQNNGLWYRETGGKNSTHDILQGNNPHVGPYDGGYVYINQFKSLIPNFSAVSFSSTTELVDEVKLFTNYNLGEITNYSGETYVNATYSDSSDINDCVIVTSSIIQDPNPQETTNECGCTPDSDDDSLSVCLKVIKKVDDLSCKNVYYYGENTEAGPITFNNYTYNDKGEIIYDGSLPRTYRTHFITKECCSAIGGKPTLFSDVSDVINTGYACCKGPNCGCWLAYGWLPLSDVYSIPLIGENQAKYMQFIKLDGSLGVTTPDGTHCLVGSKKYTEPVPNIKDPYTNEIGFGCKLTKNGLNDLALGSQGAMYQHMFNIYNGKTFRCTKIK